MIINREGPFSYADIWPFANTEEDARRQKRIAVRDNGDVLYNGQVWTATEVMEYVGQMLIGFSKAFEIANEVKGDRACRAEKCECSQKKT